MSINNFDLFLSIWYGIFFFFFLQYVKWIHTKNKSFFLDLLKASDKNLKGIEIERCTFINLQFKICKKRKLSPLSFIGAHNGIGSDLVAHLPHAPPPQFPYSRPAALAEGGGLSVSEDQSLRLCTSADIVQLEMVFIMT